MPLKKAKEKSIDSETKKILVEVSPNHFRPAAVDFLLGDASEAKAKLVWQPRTRFAEVVKIMVNADFRRETVNRVKQEVH